MISQALGRLHVRTTATEQQDDLLSEPDISPRRSPTNPLDTSTSSPEDNVIINVSPTHLPKFTKRKQKRRSNNLLMSGKLRDDVDFRIVREGSGGSAPSNAGSDTSTVSRTLRTKFNFLLPGFPEADFSGISAPTSPTVFADCESLSTSQTAFLDSSPNTSTEIWQSHTFQHNQAKRASLALEEVIREIEDEAKEARVDDDIVLLHSPVADQRQMIFNDRVNLEWEQEQEEDEGEDEEVFTVTALTNDDPVMDQPSAQSSALMYEASRSMSPTHRVPGYIPGMQRPMTPHEILESKEHFSTILQATTSRPFPGGYHDGAVDAANHPTHGRYGSENSQNDSISSFIEVHNPNFLSTSPKSNVNKTIARSVDSPALPESLHIESQHSNARYYSPGDEEGAGDHERAPSVISGKDPGPLLPFPRMSRSPIPDGNVLPTTTAARTANHRGNVGNRARSPSFSLDRSNNMSAPMTMKHFTRLPVFTSSSNSSRSSLRSEGSSYHSIGEEDEKNDCVKALFADIERESLEWHDFMDVGINTACVPSDLEEVSFRSLAKEEELVKRLSGLNKDVFFAVQRKLLDVVRPKAVRDNASTHLLTPALRVFTGQLGSPNSLTPDDDGIAKQVSTKVEARMATRKRVFGFPMPPAVQKKADRDQTPSPTLGLGQRSKKLGRKIKGGPLPIGEDSSRDSSRRSISPGLMNTPRLVRGERDKKPPSFFVLLFTILDCPPFNEIIHWDGAKRVVLEQPQILESYILMPVFGLTGLDVFKRKLYTCGFDTVSHHALSHDAHPEAAAWEHPRLTRINPPMGFTSCDWSEVIESGKPTTKGPDEVVLEEEFHPRSPIPIPVSVGNGKTLDWSRPVDSGNPVHASIYSGLMVHHEKKLAVIRLRLQPKIRETASKVAEDLQRRYDLLFLHLETPKPLRLTSIVRWGISNSKIPAHAWKSLIPTQVIEDYLPGEPDDFPASPIPEKDWVQTVADFISGCHHLYKSTEPEPWPSAGDDRPRARSRASSRASSLSEGHVSPDDDGPSKKVVYHND